MGIFLLLLHLQVSSLITVLLILVHRSDCGLILCYLLLSSDSLRLVKGIVNGPLNADRFSYAFSQHLVKHCFSSKLCIVSMPVLNESQTLGAIEMDVFYFSPLRKVFIKQSHHVLIRSHGISRQLDVSNQKSPTLLVE
jgi:hypothetical protein